MTGPLTDLRIVEIGSIGPGPFAGMLLADHGAEVIRVDRPGIQFSRFDTMIRSRTLITLDLKEPEAIAKLRTLVRTADGLIEGFRPGTMERLGIGPEVLRTDNPRLVYGRMTGWGQSGPYAHCAGHDINYISLSGALAAIGPPERPLPPLALVGDLGGGGAMLAFAMVAAILRARQVGVGEVIDCAMTEGSGLLMTAFYGLRALGEWETRRGVNLLDGGAHFYNTFQTADGKFISIGPLEPQFYGLLLQKLGLTDDPAFRAQLKKASWPILTDKLRHVFATRTRDEWCTLLESTDVCFAPVLDMSEAPHHPHAVARSSFVDVNGVVQPAPAPKYSLSTLDPPRAPIATDIDTLLQQGKR